MFITVKRTPKLEIHRDISWTQNDQTNLLRKVKPRVYWLEESHT